MNFGSKFCTAIQAAYQHPRAMVKINGQISSSFDIARGTRQRCPLSPLLFALAMELLAEALQSLVDYKGIQIGKQTHKLSMFADDLVLYIQGPKWSLQEIESVLTIF